MTKIEAKKNVLKHAFWLEYPKLYDNRDYTFENLFSDLIRTVPQNCIDDYNNVFESMIENDELPLIPVIPIGYVGESDKVALNYY